LSLHSAGPGRGAEQKRKTATGFKYNWPALHLVSPEYRVFSAVFPGKSSQLLRNLQRVSLADRQGSLDEPAGANAAQRTVRLC
jgi:hypothetical protein